MREDKRFDVCFPFSFVGEINDNMTASDQFPPWFLPCMAELQRSGTLNNTLYTRYGFCTYGGNGPNRTDVVRSSCSRIFVHQRTKKVRLTMYYFLSPIGEKRRFDFLFPFPVIGQKKARWHHTSTAVVLLLYISRRVSEKRGHMWVLRVTYGRIAQNWMDVVNWSLFIFFVHLSEEES